MEDKQPSFDDLSAKLEFIESKASSKKGIKSFKERKQEEELNDSKWIRWLRITLQVSLLLILLFEILFVSYVMLSQGIHHLLFTDIPFKLSEWAFAPFISVAIAQTCILIQPIAKNLFPK